MARKAASLAKDLTAAIRGGHPWLFDRAVTLPRAVQPGEIVDVAWRGSAVAVGYADPGSPIAVRILGGERTGPSSEWARERARLAAAMRAADPRLGECDGVRLLHGENDGLPGLVIDLYAGWAVVVFDGAGARAFWRPHLEAVIDGIEAAGYAVAGAWIRAQGRRGGAGELARGQPPPDEIEIHENRARFPVDVRRGQKTGFFLDQRDNRLVGRELAAGAEVLNLFGYTGGFSVHAALGGAARVTTVDIAGPAVEVAKRAFALNGLEPGAHRFATSDARQELSRLTDRGERFDLVICDPPSFAPSEKSRGKALRAYRELNRAVLGVVAPGGHLLTASCSSHVSEADLIECLARAAREAGRTVRLREIRGAASDHPVRPGFSEGRYLTCLVAYVD